jgi:hypothetical protein
VRTRPGHFVGWLADPGPPFSGPVFVPYGQRSLVLIGANGCGKTRLLNAIVDPATPRFFARLPARLVPYLTMARSRVESGAAVEGPPDAADLFQQAEAARPGGDEHEWWAGRLGLPGLRWVVRCADGSAPATISAVDGDDPVADPAAVIRAAPRHVSGVLERWTVPDEQSAQSLAPGTEDAFRAWAGDVLAASGSSFRVSANPLIAVDAAGVSVSLLDLALGFAEVLATRVSTRLGLLTGISADLRCVPAERFCWELRIDDQWIPLEWASRAVSRWSALTARETLQELGKYAADAVAADAAVDLAAVLNGNLDGVLIPPGDPGAFATQSSWVALDEPEVHLFASESHRLGDVLAGHGRAGRTIIVTHSLDLAARFVGNADFVMFDGPGRFTVGRPSDGLAALLQRLTRTGPGILAETRVLYVEGDWDVELIQLLHGDLLVQHNILLSRMHGVRGASLAASSVWQRMMATSFGMMFDALNADDVARKWAALRATVAQGQRRQALQSLRQKIKAARDRGGPYEDIELLRLFAAVLEGGLEDRLHLVMHGLSDIFQVMHPSAFGLPEASWREAGYEGQVSFKEFVRARAGVDLGNGDSCRQSVRAFKAAGLPVDAEAGGKLSGALREFADGTG